MVVTGIITFAMETTSWVISHKITQLKSDPGWKTTKHSRLKPYGCLLERSLNFMVWFGLVWFGLELGLELGLGLGLGLELGLELEWDLFR